MAIGLDNMSLTRNTTLRSLSETASKVTAGMTVAQVAEIAEQNDAESATSWLKGLFTFNANGELVEDVWIRTAKAGRQPDADVLAWAARIWAEPRIAHIVEEVLTDPDGRIDPSQVSTDTVERALSHDHSGESLRKAASTLLNQMAQAHIFEPSKHGGTIVGVDRLLPTARFVPLVVEMVAERLRDLVGTLVTERGDPVELALLWKANRWLGLTQDEFRRAARPRASVPRSVRPAVPPHLTLVDEELRRRRQVVLQGAPGVGKTYMAMRYVDWATAERRHESHLTTVLDRLAANERTPGRVAQEAVDSGLTAIWDIAQFHPSYGYEDFVRTLAPRSAPGGVTFHAEHRILSFLAAVGVALSELDAKCDVVLVIDEVNRADIARVFGELLYALEYRNDPVRTLYAVDGDAAMVLPENLLLIGTMNTADRSIALIDYALRRRFTFIDLAPDSNVIRDARWLGTRDRAGALALFERVQTLFTGGDVAQASLAVGHSYFLPSGSPGDENASLRNLSRQFAFEVVPLLAEYAAEGLIDTDRLATVLSEVGVQTGHGSPKVERDVLQWLSTRS